MRGREKGPEPGLVDPISGQISSAALAKPPRGTPPAECLAWSYGGAELAPREETHSYAYVQGGQLLDYSAADGRYHVWTLAETPRAGCPGVQWPPAAKGQLAVLRHRMSALPAAAGGAFALLDYDPANGDYRVGACNRSVSLTAGNGLDCRTALNGTWHTGGLQLLWVGRSTLLRWLVTPNRGAPSIDGTKH